MSGSQVDQWKRAAQLFYAVVDLPAAERAERLARDCAEDPGLRAAVEKLLATDERERGHTGAGAVQLVADALQAWSGGGELAAGTEIGPFRCVRLLGSGGMGQVYLAERSIDGHMQQVALKLPQLRPGSEFLTRFRRERAILVQLQHPAIARLIDAGELADGRPYLAMEYVDGVPITEHCRERKLDLTMRVRLVITVLQALQHAHERLVLHRDIKSANILVDASGQPRVLDFGIGKQLEESPQVTEDSQRYFSLASAAPEQIRGEPSSAATDVYAVGVLLYQLLAGVPPLVLDEQDMHKALRAAVEQVPLLASAAVLALTAPERAALASERSLRASSFATALRGDLDQILARALRKEPAQRYATAAAFAADLEAVLASRPISARQSERWYRLHRFLRRHALAVSLSTVLVASVVGFLTLTLIQSAALRAARDQAEQRRAQAEQVTDFLKNLFRQADPTVARGREFTAQDLLNQGIEKLRSSLQDQPATKAELLSVMADIELSLGRSDQALALAQEAATTGLESPASLILLARIHIVRGEHQQVIDDIDAAYPNLQVGPALSNPVFFLASLRLIALTNMEGAAHHLDAWHTLVNEAIRRHGANDPRTVDLRRRLAFQLGSVGDADGERVILSELTNGLDLSTATDDPATATLARRSAAMARDRGEFAQAERLAHYALGMQTRIYGPRHAEVVKAMNTLATIKHAAGDYQAARQEYEAALLLANEAFEPSSAAHAVIRISLGTLLLYSLADPAAALPHLEEAVALLERQAAGSANLHLAEQHFGNAHADLGNTEQARIYLDRALQGFLPTAAEHPATVANLRAALVCLVPTAQRELNWQQGVSGALAQLTAVDPRSEQIPRLTRCLVQR